MQLPFLRAIPIDGLPWSAFMIFTKQPVEAEKVIRGGRGEITSIKGTDGLGAVLRKDGRAYER